ncbi:MAG TPA: methyltransferase domain-containing protein [Gemmatales bacterium]|nr:methyltransferase domain-containing protein [Gemmatales bacterium]HMP61113.1 methyltransferase domain-containing protein [Gemmatales bacterium]
MLDFVKDWVRPRPPRSSRSRSAPPAALDRETLARAYLRGHGLEIGALHQPLVVPAAARVQYVDRLPVAELRRHYPELRDWPLVEPDILDDGETLSKVTEESQDFVIANHFLEHCEDAIGTLRNLRRVLRTAGILYLAVPDKRFTFDRDRPVTPLGHLYADHLLGPAASRRQHLEEWVWLVNKAQDQAEAEQQLEYLESIRYSIHFHVWTPPAWLEFILAMQREQGWDLEAFVQHGPEMITILKRAADAACPA